MADWQPGDLALCVASSHENDPTARASAWKARRGGIYTVQNILLVGKAAEIGLCFVEDTDPCPFSAWDARDFRKITPGNEPEGIEEPRRVPVKEVEHG